MPTIKRSLLLTAILFGILLISQLQIHLPIASGTIEKINWKTYTAPGSIFTIEYPSKWEPRNVSYHELEPNYVQFVYDGGDNNLYDDSFAQVVAYSSPHSSYSTSREMIENDTASITNDTSGYESILEQGIECDTYLVNGVQGCSVISLSSHTQGFVDQESLAVDAVDNKTGIEYTMLLAASGDVFEFFKPVFDHMVNSFRLSPNAYI